MTAASSTAEELAAARVDRNAIEIRHLLDLVAFELHRLKLEPGTPVRLSAGQPNLTEELADRLWPDHVCGPDVVSPVAVHLFAADSGAHLTAGDADHVLIAFRNRISHKSLLQADWQGTSFASLERNVSRSYRLVSSRGVMGPLILARLTVAAAISRSGRYGRGFHMNDRALLSPSDTSPFRYLCPYGLVVGSKGP